MKIKPMLAALLLAATLHSCQQTNKEAAPATTATNDEDFVWKTEEFADLKVIRFQVPGFEKLSLQQKKLVYYLTQAGLAGRDILWDQNYRHNLAIRKTVELIFEKYTGDKNAADWKAFEVYAKRVFVANGIHHHYSNDKIMPEFKADYLKTLLTASGATLSPEALDAMFNNKDMKRTNQDPAKGLVEGSAINFYEPGLKTDEVEAF